ncbi:MAG: hypothetical protein R6U43_09605 [Candidatus Krumholzibacteriales bacterium]
MNKNIFLNGFPATLIAFLLVVIPVEAAAYVGPGTGISLIGAIIAVLAALFFTVGGILLWPFRALRRWMKKRKGEDVEEEQQPQSKVTEDTDD